MDRGNCTELVKHCQPYQEPTTGETPLKIEASFSKLLMSLVAPLPVFLFLRFILLPIHWWSSWASSRDLFHLESPRTKRGPAGPLSIAGFCQQAPSLSQTKRWRNVCRTEYLSHCVTLKQSLETSPPNKWFLHVLKTFPPKHQGMLWS